jgi:hypothetical protein
MAIFHMFAGADLVPSPDLYLLKLAGAVAISSKL